MSGLTAHQGSTGSNDPGGPTDEDYPELTYPKNAPQGWKQNHIGAENLQEQDLKDWLKPRFHAWLDDNDYQRDSILLPVMKKTTEMYHFYFPEKLNKEQLSEIDKLRKLPNDYQTR